jgi:hypothetical protein
VPQLVEAVRGYAAYEKATLAAVTELRANALGFGPGRGAARFGAESELGAKVKQLLLFRALWLYQNPEPLGHWHYFSYLLSVRPDGLGVLTVLAVKCRFGSGGTVRVFEKPTLARMSVGRGRERAQPARRRRSSFCSKPVVQRRRQAQGEYVLMPIKYDFKEH